MYVAHETEMDTKPHRTQDQDKSKHISVLQLFQKRKLSRVSYSYTRLNKLII